MTSNHSPFSIRREDLLKRQKRLYNKLARFEEAYDSTGNTRDLLELEYQITQLKTALIEIDDELRSIEQKSTLSPERVITQNPSQNQKIAFMPEEVLPISNTTVSPKQSKIGDVDIVKEDISRTLPSEANDNSAQIIDRQPPKTPLSSFPNANLPYIIKKINQKMIDFVEVNAVELIGPLVCILSVPILLISLLIGNATFVLVGGVAMVLGIIAIIIWIIYKRFSKRNISIVEPPDESL